jgi:hypothetical protein
VETSLLQRLQRYCEYLDSDRDYIVSQALEIAFRKDRGFSEWLASQGAPVSMPDTPPEETPVDEVVPAPGRKTRRPRATSAASSSEGGSPTV